VNATGNTDLLQRLAAVNVGLVMIDRDDHPTVNCDRVLTDDVKVGRLATGHLIEQGRTAIGHIMGPPIAHAKRRAEGYRSALKEHRVRPRPEWVVRGGFMEQDGYRAMKKLLALEPRVDAVFAANDPAAIGAMKAIWDAGLRVPEEIAIVGAGQIALGDLLRVGLSTVGWSRDEQGRRAAELLLDRIGPEPSDQFRTVVIEPHLIVRRSSGGS
jgi:LacI family transcriptional regulator